MTKAPKKLSPSPLAQRIRSRMSALGISQAELARRANVSPVFLSELLRGAKQTVKPDRLLAFAVALGVTTDSLVGAAYLSRIKYPPFKAPAGRRTLTEEEVADYKLTDEIVAEENAAAKPLKSLLSSSRRNKDSFRAAGSIEAPIPAYGETVNGLVVIDPLAAGTVPRPPLLLWSDGAYAVIADSSMTPRYNSGEILYVAPGTTVRDGDYVVVVTRIEGERALRGRICRLKATMPEAVLVETLSPQRTESIARDSVAYIHRIVLAGQQSLE